MFSQNIKVFKITLLGFKFHNNHLLLSIFISNYQSFQNTSLGIQIWQQPFNPISFASKVYQDFQNTFLRIQIRQWPFNPITFASKVFQVFKIPLIRIQIRQWLFNPMPFSRFSLDSNCLVSSWFKFDNNCLILCVLQDSDLATTI